MRKVRQNKGFLTLWSWEIQDVRKKLEFLGGRSLSKAVGELKKHKFFFNEVTSNFKGYPSKPIDLK